MSLNYGWRNFLCQEMRLDKNSFQLAQGALGLQTSNDAGLFLMADAIPPPSPLGFYDATSMNRRSSAYLELLSALLPENNPQALRSELKDLYAGWRSWEYLAKPMLGEGYRRYFQRWATMQSLSPGLTTAAETAIASSTNCLLRSAFDAYNDPNNYEIIVENSGAITAVPIYSATYQSAYQAIAEGKSIPALNFDSNAIGDYVRFEANSAGPGIFRIFSDVTDDANAICAKAAGNRLTVTGRIGAYAILPTAPGKWYTPAEVKRAFDGKGDAQIWDPESSAGDWDSFFDPATGSLVRHIQDLLLVSDYDITVTSYATYSRDEFGQILGKLSRGVWPLASTGRSPKQQVTPLLNSDSTLTVRQQLGAGEIQIWGVTVQPAPWMSCAS
jgi:hypothetical protein